MNRQVLLVDDEPSISAVLTRALRTRGCPVEWVSSGEKALAALASSEPDVLVLDINLPDITGWEVLRQLSPAKRATLPVIVYSAATPAPDRVAQFRPAGVLTKPFPMEALVRLVASATNPQNGSCELDVVPGHGGVRSAAPPQGVEIVIVGQDLRWALRTVAQAQPLSKQITVMHRTDPIRAAQLALQRGPAALVVRVPAGTTSDDIRPILDPSSPTHCILVLSDSPTPDLWALVRACGGAICSVEEPPVLIAATLIAMLARTPV